MTGARILGVGVDLVDIRRIERALERFDARFRSRIFTEAEQALCEGRRRSRGASYARRWAAKEAAAKALGTGLAGGLSMGVGWRELEVVTAPSGKPTLRLHGASAHRARALAEAIGHGGAEIAAHVSMTDEPPYAQAIVILEAAPAPMRRPEAPQP